MTEREALKLALEALDYIRNCETDVVSQTKYGKAAEAIKEALAQTEQEPVAWGMPSAGGGFVVDCITPEEHDRVEGGYTVPLYTTPPQRTWVGLTDEEFTRVQQETPYNQFMTVREYATQCQIRHEAKLKEKNT